MFTRADRMKVREAQQVQEGPRRVRRKVELKRDEPTKTTILTLSGAHIRVDQRRAMLAKLLVAYPTDNMDALYQRMRNGDEALGLPPVEYSDEKLQRDVVELKKEWKERRLIDMTIWVAQEDEMLLHLHEAVYPQALEGDLDAIASVLKISERRSRLLGLDAPARVQQQNLNIHVLRGPAVTGPTEIETVDYRVMEPISQGEEKE